MTAIKPNLSTYLVICAMLAYLGSCLTQYIGVFVPTIKDYAQVGAFLGAAFGLALLHSPRFARACGEICMWPPRRLAEFREYVRSFVAGVRGSDNQL
ncbi:hypothetical protein K2Q08_01240, partial [Patescibacteria group bacterium]|nr:hypothetical protein [Patescibacteria group bacterium]